MDEQIPAIPASCRFLARMWSYRLSVALIIAGCLLHLTVRDRSPLPVALLYYGLPRPILLGLALWAAVAAGRSWFRWFWLTAAGLFAATVWCQDVELHAPAKDISTFQTVVFWNVGRNLDDDVAIVNGFLDAGADLVGLVETGDLSTAWLDDWRKRRTDYELVKLPNDCLLAVRGTVLDQGEISLPSGSFASWVDVDLQGVTVRAVVVDIVASLWQSRQEPFWELEAVLNSREDRPIIVMGDFNAPDESVWLEGIQPKFREVFRAAGSGYAPTWPWPVPVLKLDQIWISRNIGLRRAWQTGSWRSDHRIVWAEVRWESGAEGE